MALTHLWHLEEASGTRVDSIGELDLTVTSGSDSTVAATGIIGDALNSEVGFGALSSGTVRMLDSNGCDAFSFSAWLFFDNAAGSTEIAIEYANATTTMFRMERVPGGEMQVTARNANSDVYTVTGSTVTAASTWYFVNGTFARSGFLRLYVNGTEEGTAAATGNFPWLSASPSPRFVLASRQSNLDSVIGRLDEVSADNSELASGTITALYNSGSGTDRAVGYLGDFATGLANHWELEEAAGDRVDSVGSFDFTVIGNQGSASAIVGDGMVFDGTTNYLERLTTPSFSAVDEITLALWVNFGDAIGSRESLVRMLAVTGTLHLILLDRRADGQCDFRVWNSAGTNDQNTAPAGTMVDSTWFHITGVYKRNAYQRLFINGSTVLTQERYSDDQTTRDVSSDPMVRVGNDHNGSFELGNAVVDEIRAYTRALTCGDVKALYDAQAPLSTGVNARRFSNGWFRKAS